MPKKSIADKIIEELDTEDSEGPFILMYYLPRPKGKAIHPGFWRNLNRLFTKLEDGKRIQRSVIKCKMLRTAMAIKALAERFEARDVVIYRVQRIET
ncbi:hypothetical protein ES702_00548 [subsurface metagenome]